MKPFPELSAEQVRRTIDPQTLDIQSSEQVAPVAGIIGQRRAVAALRFGLGVRDGGFNIYVAGPPGIGKMTAVRSFLADIARTKATPPDLCYTANFDDSYQPRVYSLPAGRGRALQQDVQRVIAQVRQGIPKAFDGETYTAERETIEAAKLEKSL